MCCTSGTDGVLVKELTRVRHTTVRAVEVENADFNGSQSTKRLRGLLHQYAWIPFFHWLFLRPEVNLLH